MHSWLYFYHAKDPAVLESLQEGATDDIKDIVENTEDATEDTDKVMDYSCQDHYMALHDVATFCVFVFLHGTSGGKSHLTHVQRMCFTGNYFYNTENIQKGVRMCYHITFMNYFSK